MEPISSINPLTILNSQIHRNQILTEPAISISDSHAQTEQESLTSFRAGLVGQLSQNTARNVGNIFRSINLLANQSLELGTGFLTRERFQIEVSNDLSNLRSIFDDLPQEELTLFTTLFQNRLPDSILNTGSSNENIFSSLNLNGFSNDALDSLFQLDVTSEQESLLTLGLTNTLIDILSINNNDSSFLESLLDDLTNDFFNFRVPEETPDEDEESTTTPEVRESDVNLQNQIPPLTSPDGNPPTIIELAG